MFTFRHRGNLIIFDTFIGVGNFRHFFLGLKNFRLFFYRCRKFPTLFSRCRKIFRTFFLGVENFRHFFRHFFLHFLLWTLGVEKKTSNFVVEIEFDTESTRFRQTWDSTRFRSPKIELGFAC
jgi:hypothetical protein